MKLHRWKDIKNRRFTAEQLEELRRRREREDMEMSLVELRKMAGKTQVEVAKEMDLVRAAVSDIEHRDDRLVSTLRRYVEALGGELEIVARLGNKTVRLV